MSRKYFPDWLTLSGIIVAALMFVITSQAPVEAATKEVKSSNYCQPLNTVSQNGVKYRKAFSAITPLVKQGGQVKKSSCAALLKKVQNPGPEKAADLPAYQNALNEFFSNYCYRDVSSGWKHDIELRDTGPFIQTATQGDWTGSEKGTHNAVVIWYSPEFYEFVEKRAAGDDTFEMPEGAMSVKEMFNPPSSQCKGEDPINFKPTSHGIAFFVRHSKISMDGWYWGSFGWNKFPAQVTDLKDQAAVDKYFSDIKDNLASNQSWQPKANTTYGVGVGWGTGCLDCHASAESFQTFADIKNITGGTPEDPINTYLSMNFPTTAAATPSKHAMDAKSHSAQALAKLSPPYNPAFLKTFPPKGIFTGGVAPSDSSVDRMPPASFDTVWVKANKAHDKAGVDSQYITSDQCFGCHDTGQTGLLFDMSTNDPDTKEFIDQAPYGTWRTSPMGLSGRDPIFFAQLASEQQTFHKDYVEKNPRVIEDICLGCHGLNGQRQYTLDHAQANGGECGTFTRDMLNQIPVASPGSAPGKHPNYGALARDGISCSSCHNAIFKKDDIAKHFTNYGPDAQNKCIVARQQLLNPGVNHDTLAATFTGSFLVGSPDRIAGQFKSPKVKPMQNALGLTPMHDDTYGKSDLCGSCHTVHLPVLHQAKIVGTVFEQTTYAEWAFSDFRTGWSANYPNGMGTLPSGQPSAGKLKVSCQQCHMESSNSHANKDFPAGLVFPSMDPDDQYVSKIATIQEKSNFPQADNTLPAADIDLERRSGFARHTLVGLNVFLMSMAKQFPDVLGLPTDARGYISSDPKVQKHSLPYIDRTLRHMKNNAKSKTATISVEQLELSADTLNARVKVTSGVAHKFPSGVGFRRAFVEFKVLDGSGNTLWGSGVTNGAGVIMDNGSNPNHSKPIDGELWWDNTCNPVKDRLAFQPHFDAEQNPVSKQSQAQIYQELVITPPQKYKISAEVPGKQTLKKKPVSMCGTHLDPGDEKSAYYPGWNLTTSFLAICAQAKDNRLLPQGYLPLKDRLFIAKKFTQNKPPAKPGKNADSMAEKLAREGGSVGVGNDPDYNSKNGKPYGGGDTFSYAIPRKDIKGEPASVVASIYYQATPPFYLQDRFCTAQGDDRDRLYYLAGKINLDNLAKDWKLPIASANRPVSGQ